MTHKHENKPIINNGNTLGPVSNPPPLSPLSPNICKNPMSPTAKIKMFSNTLAVNKKPLSNANTILFQNNQ
jgi:hypothetical protein